MSLIFAYAGRKKDVYWLLFYLSKNTQKYIVNREARIKPVLIDEKVIIEWYTLKKKNCGWSYTGGALKRQTIGPYKFDPVPELGNDERVWKERQTLPNGDDYEGEWNLNGQRHGQGIMIDKDGLLYEGWFLNDKQYGHGREIVGRGGAYYEGEWLNGREHGKGLFYYGDAWPRKY